MDQQATRQAPIVRIAVAVFGLLTIATLLLAIFNDKGALQVHAQAQKLGALETEILTIESENKMLSDEIQALRTDPATIEKLAREELRLVKPGEVVLVTPGDTPPPASTEQK
jgi:cell division protein FtsB